MLLLLTIYILSAAIVFSAAIRTCTEEELEKHKRGAIVSVFFPILNTIVALAFLLMFTIVMVFDK